jgi:hypothetical protein
MADLSAYVVYGVAVLVVVFAIEAAYALFFRNFGLVKFRLAFTVPGADAKTVWATYFDGLNAWNSVTERLSYDVVSDAPRIIRSTARRRGTADKAITSEWRLDILEPEKSCRATIITVDGAEVPVAEQTSETFAVSPGDGGTEVTVEAELPVRGWLRVPLHRRYLGRIFEDLRMACMRKAGVPFTAMERRWGIWTELPADHAS